MDIGGRQLNTGKRIYPKNDSLPYLFKLTFALLRISLIVLFATPYFVTKSLCLGRGTDSDSDMIFRFVSNNISDLAHYFGWL